MFDLFHLTHKHSGGDGALIDHGDLLGLTDNDHTQYALAAKGVTNGDSHDHVGGDGAQIDHGGLAGLGDDDHTQYIKHALATAQNDFLVASGAGAFVKKTLAETLAILGITPYHCRVYNSANISAANNSAVYLTFNSEQSDQGGMHSTSSNTGRINFLEAGFYIVGGGVTFAANSTGLRAIFIRRNGSTILESDNRTAATSGADLAISTGYYFSLNDYIELGVYQSSGGSLNVLAYNSGPSFWAAKVL